jgi:hypothetical protein
MKSEQSKLYASQIQTHQSDVVIQSLDDLLALAQRYRHQGDPRQAEDILWKLVQDHAETLQAEIAKNSLMLMAHEYERDGCAHAARAIYERLA